MAKKTKPLLGYVGRSKFYARIHDDLYDSPAFRTLPAKTQLVLIDMIRVYFKVSSSDTRRLDGEGLFYTYEQCQVEVSSKYLYGTALPLIQAHGFFRFAPELKSLRPGSPKPYLPSRDWETYKPTDEAAKQGREFQLKKEHSLWRDKQRRTKFRASLNDRH